MVARHVKFGETTHDKTVVAVAGRGGAKSVGCGLIRLLVTPGQGRADVDDLAVDLVAKVTVGRERQVKLRQDRQQELTDDQRGDHVPVTESADAFHDHIFCLARLSVV